jgi:hypothetical protein
MIRRRKALAERLHLHRHGAPQETREIVERER